MKIDDVIKKCIEIPGISLKNEKHSIELIFEENGGKGSMTFFSLFPGITLAYIFINAPTWPAPNFSNEESNLKGPLLLNYCVTGRCEIILNNENFIYVKDEEISMTECFAQKKYVYPRHTYEGLEFFIDLDVINVYSKWIKKEFGLDCSGILEKYCPNGKTYISTVTLEVGETLKRLWSFYDLPHQYGILQMKIYTLELFTLLLNIADIPQSQTRTFFTETQVDIAKRVEKIITADLRQHHPAWELAAQFGISETSLKNYFRGVFGENISIYLREIRMKKASELLLSTKESVSKIAEQVGYKNQSKFAYVFKKYFNFAPLEYRRIKRLEKIRTQ